MTPTRFENLATHIVFVRFDLKSSEMLRRIDWQTDTDVSKALRSFETSTTVYQSIPRNISEGLNLKQINDPTDSILGPPPPAVPYGCFSSFIISLVIKLFLSPYAVPLRKLLAPV